MSLTERSRHKPFETFTDLVGDEQAVEEMLSYFPARNLDEPLTKDFLRAELQTQIGAVRGEVDGLRTELHTEIGSLRAEMLHLARSTQMWIISTGLTLAGLILALDRFS